MATREIRRHSRRRDLVRAITLSLFKKQNVAHRAFLLADEEDEWPNEFVQICEISELKKNICLMTNNNDLSILDRFASYSRLLRVVVYCFLPNHKNVGDLPQKKLSRQKYEF